MADSARRSARSLLRIDWIGRFGYAVRALLYVLLGFLTLRHAAGRGVGSAFGALHDLPGGTVLEFIAGVGLACYGFFHIANGILNLDRRPRGLKGAGSRIGRLACGIAYAGLGSIGLKVALAGGSVGSGRTSEKAAHTAMLFPGGTYLVVLVGAGFAIAAIDQFAKAATASFRSEMRADAPTAVVLVGRVGFAGHAILLAAVGWLIAKAGWQSQSRPIGAGPAIEALRGVHWLYTALALGLIAFGIFSLLMAWYRQVDATDIFQRLSRVDR